MKKFVNLFLFIVLFSALSTSVFAQESNTKVSGLAYVDYYWFAQNHNPDYKGQHGLWFRRIYLTVDHKISNSFSSRLRFEMNQPGKFGDSVTKEKMGAIVKDAYLKYKTGAHSFYLGVSSSPAFSLLEKVWGYRSVERTMTDLQKFESSRDIGLAAKGSFGKEKLFGYHIMLGNGASNSSEINKGKKFLGAFNINPNKNLVFELFGSYSDNFGESDQYTLQGFAGYKSKKLNAGVQLFSQTRKYEGAEDESYTGLSIFGRGVLSEKWNLLARVDRMFDPSPANEKISYLPFAKDVKSTLIILGADFSPVKGVKIIPNIEMILYDENSNGVKPDSDLVTRLTVHYAI